MFEKSSVITEHQKHSSDTGSAAVQVALLTHRINYLTEHLKVAKKDHSSRRGLIRLVNKRRRLLDHMSSKDQNGYQETLQKLKLRR